MPHCLLSVYGTAKAVPLSKTDFFNILQSPVIHERLAAWLKSHLFKNQDLIRGCFEAVVVDAACFRCEGASRHAQNMEVLRYAQNDKQNHML